MVWSVEDYEDECATMKILVKKWYQNHDTWTPECPVEVLNRVKQALELRRRGRRNV
jgi:hypothetical protein